jgi:hypothetical protein
VLHCVVLEDKDSVVVLLVVFIVPVVLFLDTMELDEMTVLLVVTGLDVLLEVLVVVYVTTLETTLEVLEPTGQLVTSGGQE